ncbi:MAG: hypothetical protein ACK417_09015 [Bacteroidia bacterium]
MCSLLAALLSKPAKACDFCGCGPAGQFFGMLPILDGRYASIRTQQQQFKHPATTANTLDGEAIRYDRMQSLELWVRWQLDSSWQIIVQMPWRHHDRIGKQGSLSSISGPGDASITAFYKLKLPALKGNWQQSASLGAQSGLPTGPYQQRDAKKRLLPMPFQTGTGSYSAMLQAFYTLSRSSKGLQVESRIRRFTTNELDFKPGNALGASAQLFSNRQGKRLRYMHYAGCTYDRLDYDYEFGQAKANTGGAIFGLSAGTDVYTAKSAFHLLAQLPLVQQLGAAQPINSFRLMLGYSRAF